MSELKGACIIGQSGGPTSVINASAYGVIRTALDSDCITAVYGAEHGIKGVLADRLFDMSKEDARELELLKYTPSSALGSCRYKIADPDVDDTDYKRILEVFKKHDVRYFFYNGGNDSMDTCNKISKYMQKVGYECRVMGVPKTIDNDTWGTELTFGFTSAIDVATKCIDDIHTTASSHGRVFVIEIMGHKVGWIPLYAGVAGGADVILIPEIPYDMDQVIKTIEHRMEPGSRFTIVAVAEGAISKEDAALSKKEYKKKLAERTSPSIVYDIAKEIEAKTGRETRVAIPGHTQRGGQPDAQDRIFATQCGVEAALGCLRGEFGYMIALRDGKMCHMPLEDVAGKLKYVDPQSDLVREAKALGISFGDE